MRHKVYRLCSPIQLGLVLLCWPVTWSRSSCSCDAAVPGGRCLMPIMRCEAAWPLGSLPTCMCLQSLPLAGVACRPGYDYATTLRVIATASAPDVWIHPGVKRRQCEHLTAFLLLLGLGLPSGFCSTSLQHPGCLSCQVTSVPYLCCFGYALKLRPNFTSACLVLANFFC